MAIGLIVIVGGLGFFYLGVSFRKDAQNSLGWPKTDGTITNSKVIHTVSASASGNSNYWEPHIEYSYSVGNKEYSANKIVLGSVGTTPWLAKSESDQYQVGSIVQVFYNPQDHSEAILKPGVT